MSIWQSGPERDSPAGDGKRGNGLPRRVRTDYASRIGSPARDSSNFGPTMRPSRPLLLTCVLPLLALAWALGLTAPARAGCGDYVVVGSGHAPLATHHDAPTLPGPAPPCSGPNC